MLSDGLAKSAVAFYSQKVAKAEQCVPRKTVSLEEKRDCVHTSGWNGSYWGYRALCSRGCGSLDGVSSVLGHCISGSALKQGDGDKLPNNPQIKSVPYYSIIFT